MSHPATNRFTVSENATNDCMPDSLNMFINILLGGQELLDRSNEDTD